MIDLNNEEKQSAAFQPIPPNSRVLVKLCINYPEDMRRGSEYPLTSSRNSPLEYLATSLEVLSPSFKGQKIRHNFNLSGASTDGQTKAVNISRKQIRALVEANFGIHPDDSTPQATQRRRLNAWTDLDGMTFPVVVDCEVSNTNGKKYLNNTLKAVVTMEDADFATLRNGGESITDQPLPDTSSNPQAMPASPAPSWAAPQQSAPAQSAPKPGWAQSSAPVAPAPQTWAQPSAPGTMPPPPPPSNPGQMPMWGSENRNSADIPF